MTTRQDEMTLGLFIYPADRQIAAWRHPAAQTDAGVNLRHYQALARVAEAAKFDLIFFADGSSTRGDDVEVLSRTAHSYIAQFELLTLLSALSAVTERIGLVGPSQPPSTSPFMWRKFASLDLPSSGRAGWNLVTSSNEREARNFSRQRHFSHEERSSRAGEFADAAVGLWNSREEDAFLRDKAVGLFFHPAKRHVLRHAGKHFRVEHLLSLPRPPGAGR
ncbi:MAG TPA: LLM class flavin-dependent oxidoreductase [Acidisoma sp.]|uniref:LLM class flavin-dependent oxidoreductase n=1 Tax=Acidisoma sp. TaxID=1872115 RepID=UPI002B8DCB7F|nr:LLM class flavin-dependent oxidoreductase [Acidisoma sp.]HTI03487.1 LLM class flavin-dependent oxidoreductase [Acidisoma sp.]